MMTLLFSRPTVLGGQSLLSLATSVSGTPVMVEVSSEEEMEVMDCQSPPADQEPAVEVEQPEDVVEDNSSEPSSSTGTHRQVNCL